MAVYKPQGRIVTTTSIGAADIYQIKLTVKNQFSLLVVTGSASTSGAVWIYESATSAGTMHKTYTLGATCKYAVTCKNGVPLTYKFIRE